MTFLRWHIGDTRKVLATLEPGSVNCVVTSPPYLAKRAYLPADHPDKPLEQGQEATPGEFLAGMLEVMDLLWDVLADDGVAFVNLGDTASGSGGAGGDYDSGGLRDGQPRYRAGYLRNDRDSRVPQAAPKAAGKPKNSGANQPDSGPRTGPGRTTLDRPDWPRAKSVCWVPELFGASLAYGFNLLTGEPCRQWITRPPMTWAKPNPSVGAIHDKFRESTELVVMATKRGAYWFDLDPVRTEPLPHSARYGDAETRARHGNPGFVVPTRVDGGRMTHGLNARGAPPLNWQDAPALPAMAVGSPAQYPGAHFAVMPPWLARLLLTVGCPVGGVVLDPYAGSGTTLDCAHSLGRSAIGIDLDARNVDLAQDRLGMFPIEVVDHRVAL